MEVSENIIPMKICTKCRVEKGLNEFNKNSKFLDGHEYRCRQCSRIMFTQYHKENRTKLNLYNKKYRLLNQKKIKNWRKKHPESAKKTNKRCHDELRTSYIVWIIHQSFPELTNSEIRKYPELIESYRQQIKIKRLLKQKKNENTKTR